MRRALVRKIIEMRASRRTFLPQWLFDGEAPWDMLLELYCASLSGKRVELDTLVESGTVSTSVSSRWLRALERAELVVVTRHMLGGPEIVAISDQGHRALETYFDTLDASSLLL